MGGNAKRRRLAGLLSLVLGAFALVGMQAPRPSSAATVDDFYMLLCSDTQLPWNELSDGTTVGDLKETAKKTNLNHVFTMNQLITTLGPRNVRGLIINGDLTAFGHDWQLDMYRGIYGGVTTRLYPGLGNHDYANNVNDTAENQAARRMVDYLHDTVEAIRPKATAKELLAQGPDALKAEDGEVRSFDYKVGKTYFKAPANRRDHEGSLAYSWEIGNVHFVQLNNYPTYTTEFNGWNFGDARRDYYTITSALTWLKKDLAEARSRGKKILLNYHDPVEHWTPSDSSWQSILADYDVSGIFAGHIHQTCGFSKNFTPKANRSVPEFRCGSALYQKYLLLHVKGDEYTVQVVDDTDDKPALGSAVTKPLF